MPVCEVCQGEHFYDKDGLFYCDICNTQSQDMRVEAKHEIEFDASLHVTLKERRAPKKQKSRQQPHNVGRMWVIYEGYQYLLKAQVEALIGMGFSTQLKDFASEVWFGLLRYHKVAFHTGEPSTMEIGKVSGEFGRKFDTIGIVCKSARNRLGRYPTSMRNKLSDDEEENEEPMQEEKEEEKAGDSSSDEEAFIRKLNSTTVVEPLTSEPPAKQAKNSIDTVTPAKEFSQKHTLAICYIALVWLQEPVLISDLIRWAREGMVPYHKGSIVIPEQMKFTGQDFFHLCHNKALRPSAVLNVTRKIVRELKLEVTRSTEDCKIMLTTLMVDLQFHPSIVRVAMRLMDLVQFEHSTNYRLLVDGYLAAFIIFAVRLVYRLDDHAECHDHTNERLLADFQLPAVESWKTWCLCYVSKVKARLARGIPANTDELKFVRDSSAYVEYLCRDMFRAFVRRTTTLATRYQKHTRKKDTKIEADSQDIYFKCLNACNSQFELETAPKRSSNSFPLSCDVYGNLLDETSNSPESEDSVEIKENMGICQNTKTEKPTFENSFEKVAGESDSFSFLTKVLSERVELDEYNLINSHLKYLLSHNMPLKVLVCKYL